MQTFLYHRENGETFSLLHTKGCLNFKESLLKTVPFFTIPVLFIKSSVRKQAAILLYTAFDYLPSYRVSFVYKV
jgi:hypothetical protein